MRAPESDRDRDGHHDSDRAAAQAFPGPDIPSRPADAAAAGAAPQRRGPPTSSLDFAESMFKYRDYGP